MTSPSDFGDLFDSCKTFRDSNEAYRQGVTILQEAHRLCMSRLVKERDSDAVPKRTAQNEPQGPQAVDLAVQRSKDAQVRRWAEMEGISFRRVSKKLRAAYEEAHENE